MMPAAPSVPGDRREVRRDPCGACQELLFAAQAGTGLANGVLDVFSPAVLPLFVVIGVAVGVAGGLLPARSAARTPVAVILHAE